MFNWTSKACFALALCGMLSLTEYLECAGRGQLSAVEVVCCLTREPSTLQALALCTWWEVMLPLLEPGFLDPVLDASCLMERYGLSMYSVSIHSDSSYQHSF